MDRAELERRTKEFALRIMELVASLPKDTVSRVIGYQIMKSGTSIGANYREAARAESRADFAHEISIAEKEAGETLYWLELLSDGDIVPKERLASLMDECDQLISILTASGKTARRKIGP